MQGRNRSSSPLNYDNGVEKKSQFCNIKVMHLSHSPQIPRLLRGRKATAREVGGTNRTIICHHVTPSAPTSRKERKQEARCIWNLRCNVALASASNGFSVVDRDWGCKWNRLNFWRMQVPEVMLRKVWMVMVQQDLLTLRSEGNGTFRGVVFGSSNVSEQDIDHNV